MAKRFTDNEKWKDEWWGSLSNDNRMIWLYLVDSCTIAGIWKKDFRGLNFNCNTLIDEKSFKEIFGPKVVDKGSYYFIPNFIRFQYPKGLKSNKPVIVSAVRELKSYNLLEMVAELFGDDFTIIDESLSNHSRTVKDKGKEKDKVTGKDQEEVKDQETYGKSENYFTGPVPEDLLDYASRLQRSALKSEAWQRKVADDIRKLGYVVTLEVACPYPSEDAEEIDGWIDIRAQKGKTVVCIECEHRVTTRDSWMKLQVYPNLLPAGIKYAGMILLRDPKPAENEGDLDFKLPLPAKQLTGSLTLEDAEYWTRQVLEDNDEIFSLLLKSRGLSGVDIKPIAEDHLKLVNRYGWFKRWDDQNAFRKSLIDHVRDKAGNLDTAKDEKVDFSQFNK